MRILNFTNYSSQFIIHQYLITRISLLLLTLGFFGGVWGQVTLTNVSPSNTQNFDAMATSTTASLPSNWKMSAQGAGSSAGWSTSGNLTATAQGANSGAPTGSGVYNWGTSSTERCLGIMTSGSYASPNGIMAFFTNGGSSNINTLTISYDLERYRINSAAASVSFFYSLNGSSWTSVSSGDIASTLLPTGLNSYSFSPSGSPSSANHGIISKSISISSINIAVNSSFYLKWVLNTTGSNSQGIGIDNVICTATFDPTTPTITGSATSTAFSTTYGTPSTAQTFPISGSNLTAGITATAPTGFEVSSDGTTYGGTATFTQSSGSASGILRIRLKADAAFGGSYNSQTIVLSSTGATSVNITTASSGNSVTKKELTISADNQTISFGTPVLTVTGAGSYTPTGFVNSETAASVIGGTASYTTTYTTTTAAGASAATITPVTTNLTASNYSFTAVNGNITVTAIVPTAPTITGITAGNSQLSVAFTAPSSNGGASITNYAYSTDNGSSFTACSPLQTTSPILITGLTNGTTYNVQIRAVNSAGSGAASNTISETPVAPSGPTITANLAILGAFTTTYGTASTAQSIPVSGAALVDDLLATAPTGFEVATSQFGTYGATATFTQTVGSASGMVWVRLAASAIPSGSYNSQAIALTSSGATPVNVSTAATGNLVSQKALTITGASTANKEYDGSFTATVTGGSLSGVVGSDIVTLTLSGNFAQSSVGNNIVITSTSTIGGANAANYTLTQPSLTARNITAKPLTITAASIASKAYDGTPATGSITLGSLSGFIGSETVTATATGAFADGNVETGKAATITYTLVNGTNGGLAINYSLAAGSGTGDITQATQTITFTTFTTPISAGTTIVATSNVNAPITYSSSNTSVATIDNSGVVTIVGNGNTTITASNAGNTNYTSATISQVLTVNPATGNLVTFPSSWSGTPTAAAAVIQNANLSSTVSVTRGSGLTGISSNSRFNSDSWSTSSTLTLSNNDYLTFTLTAASGYLLNLNNAILNFALAASGSGPSKFGVYSSVGGFGSTSNQIGADLTTSSTSVTIPSTGFNGLQSIEIRIYGWAAVAAGGTGGFSSMSLNGSVSCTTPAQPSTISGSETVCAESAQTYSVTNVSGVGYNWSLPSSSPTAWSGTSLTNSITATVGSSAGTITVTPYNSASGCANYTGTSRSLAITTVNALPSTPAVTGNSRCGTGTVALSATSGSGETTDWYAASTGGSALSIGNTAYTTPSISSSTTYHVGSRNTTTSCVSSSRTPVTATVNALPGLPTAGSAAICDAGTVTITATPSAGETIDWYAASTGGAALLSGSTSYTTPSLSSTTIYYAQARNSTTNCASASRTAVTATVNAIPSAPTTSAQVFCASSSPTVANLSATGAGILWYAAITGGSALGSATSLATATTYYASQTINNCESSRASSLITIDPTSVAGTISATSNPICSGASTALSLAGQTGSVQWQSSTNNTTFLNINGANTSALNTGVLTQTTYYKAVVTNGVCAADNSSVLTLTVDPTNTWIGNSGNWSDPNNWCGGLPTSSTAVVIANNATITLNAGAGVITQVASMTINSGATLVVPTGEQLTLTGALMNNGAMIIETGGTFKQGTSVTGNGTYNVQQYLTGSQTGGVLDGRFWYMGVPLNVTRTSSFGDETTTNRAWTWSETGQQYGIVQNATTLTPTTGIVYRRGSNGTVNFNGSGASGTGLYAQDATLTGLTKTGAFFSGYHLLANPYTAYLDFEMMNDVSNNMSSTIWTRAAIGSSASMVFDTYNATSLQGVNPSGGTSNQYIAPMQAFWVRVAGNTGTTGNISMTRAMTSHDGTGGLKSGVEYPAFARVNVVDGPRYDQTLVYLRDDQNNAVDAFDSEKMFASGLAQVYTMAVGKKLVMNGLKNNKKRISVPLYFDLPTSKVYELTLTEFNMENGIILLEDKQEGIIQDFTIHDHYAFYANSGTLNNRFVLHFYMPEVFNPYQAPSNNWANPEPVEGGIFIGSDGRGKVLVELELPSETQTDHVQILNAAGQVVFEADLNGAQTEFDLETATGIYLVKVTNGSTTEIKKIIIQH